MFYKCIDAQHNILPQLKINSLYSEASSEPEQQEIMEI